MKDLRVGIIGAGNIAGAIDLNSPREVIWSHAKAYQQHSRTKLAAACDLNRQKVSDFCKTWQIPNSYVDYNTMLKKEKFDIVSVCTPTRHHKEIVKQIAQRKVKAIFCEKPIAQTSEEADEMIAACQSNDVILAVNFMRRWDNHYLKFKKLIDEHKIGKIYNIVGYSTTALMTSSSHLIDLMLLFGGKPNWIVGIQQTDYVRQVHGIPDPGGNAMIQFKNGCIGFLKGTSKAPQNYMFELDIHGAGGRLNISEVGKIQHSFWKFTPSTATGWDEYRTLTLHPFSNTHPHSERMLNAIDDLIDCIENRKQPKSNGYTARDNLRFIETLKLSDAHDNKKIYFTN